MSTSQNPRQEQPHTYFVQDRFNRDELTRLEIQDRMLISGMGGVLPEQSDPTAFQSVLDVGCGCGRWLIEVAKTYPGIKQLVGVNTHERMIKYAQAQAEAQQVADRVQFRTMDLLNRFELPDDSFDLVNQRLGQSYARTWDWPNILSEFSRVARPGGVIRLMEGDMILDSPDPAFTQLNEILLQALHQSGHYFTQTSDGLTSKLPGLLRQYGIQHIQTKVHPLEYRAGTVEGQQLYEDTKYLFQTVLPFLHRWTRVPADFESVYQRALDEIQHPDFFATWRLVTAWGIQPPKREEQPILD